jgi:hypothetical protein
VSREGQARKGQARVQPVPESGTGAAALPQREDADPHPEGLVGSSALPMVFLDSGVGHYGSWSCRSSWSGRCLALCATAAFLDGRGSRRAAACRAAGRS